MTDHAAPLTARAQQCQIVDCDNTETQTYDGPSGSRWEFCDSHNGFFKTSELFEVVQS